MVIDIPKPLLDEVAKGRVLPFIGAGFSLNAKVANKKSMPDWKKLTEGLSSHLQTGNPDPLEVASEYQHKFGRIQLIETIRNLLCIDDARPGEAHQYFARITSFDTIYTINFDFLLEDAYKEANRNIHRTTNVRPYRVLVGETQMPFHGGPTTTNIIKMHGDFDHIDEIIITREDYRNYLNNHPIIATHLASMLITKTALFLGYSLRDPDFQQIKDVISKRLGEFERISYIVLFDAAKEKIQEYREQNLYVINLESNPTSREELLINFLKHIYDYTTLRSAERTSFFKEEEETLKEEELKSAIQNDQLNLIGSISDICFVAMSRTKDLDFIYFDIIKPAIERYGLRSLRQNELLVTEGSLMDNIRTTILQCRLVIAEITDQNPNVMYELGLSIASRKSIILLSQTDIPSELAGFLHIIYQNTVEGRNILYSRLRSEIEKLLFEDPLIQARQLMDTGFFGPAVIIIMSYLERSIENLLTRIQDLPPGKRNFRSMSDSLVKLKIIDNQQRHMLSEWRAVRNKAVHYLIQPTREQATEIINQIESFVNYLRSIESPAYSWWGVLNDHDRRVLTEKFLTTLYTLPISEREQRIKETPISSKLIFSNMALGAYTDVIVPMIVKTLEIDGYISTADESIVQLTEKGKIKSKELLGFK